MSMSTSGDIDQAVRFSIARRRGYAEAEVEVFVQRARTTIVDLSERLAVCESARAELEARLAAQAADPVVLAEAGDHPSRALRLLEMAQVSADSAVAEAERSAEQIVLEAREAADRLLQESRGSADRLVREAEQRAAAREAAARAAAEETATASHREQDRLRHELESLRGGAREARVQLQELAQRLARLLEAEPPEPIRAG